MSATVFAVLFGTSVALNVWLWFRSEHYREQASLSPEQRAQEWTPIEWPSGPMDARVFWDVESGTVQDGRLVTIANDDWKVNT